MPVKRNIPRDVSGSIVPFNAFIGNTPVVPTIYWNVYDSEQRWKWICCNLIALIDYSNEQTAAINEINNNLDSVLNEYTTKLDDFATRLETLEQALSTIVTSMLVYDPTKGKYTASIDQSRRMLQILSQPDDKNLTVDTLTNSGLTCASWANGYMCGTVINDSFKRMLNKTMPKQNVGGEINE